jgi:hypothetical protein
MKFKFYGWLEVYEKLTDGKCYGWLEVYEKLTDGKCYGILLPDYEDIWCDLETEDMEKYWKLFGIEEKDWGTKGDMVNCKHALLSFESKEELMKVYDGLEDWEGGIYIFKDGKLVDYRYGYTELQIRAVNSLAERARESLDEAMLINVLKKVKTEPITKKCISCGIEYGKKVMCPKCFGGK